MVLAFTRWGSGICVLNIKPVYALLDDGLFARSLKPNPVLKKLQYLTGSG